MRLVLIEALDMVISTSFFVKLTCFVDDVTLEVAGSAALVKEHLVEAVMSFTSTLQRAGMEFSATKNMVAASSAASLRSLKPKLAKLKVRARLRVTSLGAALGAGESGMRRWRKKGSTDSGLAAAGLAS